ncbi:MAG: cytochrome C552, partial [Hyphomicrobiales bacterium]|nr:cytochrome C552 [Hyphomicrobiales bacterium]
ETGQTCIDCHKGIAHKNIRDQLPEDQLEVLEKPLPAYVREVPQSYLESLARIEAKEAEDAAQADAEAKSAADSTRARIEAAVASARADEQAKAAAAIAAAQAGTSGDAAAAAPAAAAATAAPASGDGVAAAIDWNAVDAKTVTLFYPGQASFEWVQTGKDHGGARPFAAGDRCSTCHLKELKAMGTKIVTGSKAEDMPIPDKRPAIDMTVQAAHDDQNLYLRLQWQNGAHTPAPFVDGGKMDPENQIKVTMMIAGTGIEFAEQAGCWVTCHHDSRYMPHAPDADALAAQPGVAERIGIANGITKYLTESRTEVEVAGRRGKIRGGWEKLKDAGEIDAQRNAGGIMDLIRFRSGQGAENGVVLAERKMGVGAEVKGEGQLVGDLWTVVLSRPLKSDDLIDISIETAKTYTVGFAIHDDYTAARFHHVSLEYKLGLDDPNAELNVSKP